MRSFLHGLNGLVLVPLVVALAWDMDVVVLEEHGGCAGVFRQYKIGLLKDFDGPEGKIFQIPNRSWNYVQFSCLTFLHN